MPPLAFALLDARSGRLLEERQAEVRAWPGSTVKPFVPAIGRFPCRRQLRIGAHQFPCRHPPAYGPLDRMDAVMLSCNCFFAAAALAIPPGRLQRALWEFDARLAATNEQRQLQALGHWGVSASPLSLARAYRRLALADSEAEPLAPGFSGKTGTTAGAAWYAGWFPPEAPRLVIAVLTSGRGATDARPAAEEILARWR